MLRDGFLCQCPEESVGTASTIGDDVVNKLPVLDDWRKGTPTTCASPDAGKSRQSRACTVTRPCSDPPAFFLAAAASVMVIICLTRSRAVTRLGQNGASTHQPALETT